MILELVLTACIGQIPVAPVDDDPSPSPSPSPNPIQVENLFKQVEELQKKNEKLQAQIDRLLVERDKPKPNPFTTFKFVMSDRWGRIFGNGDYDRLRSDIEYINSQTKYVQPNPPQVQQMEYIRQTQFAPQTFGAAATCSPGGS